MSVMAESAFDEAIIDIVTPESILTSTDIINVRLFFLMVCFEANRQNLQDINTSAQPAHPSPSTFTSRFTLTSISPRRRIARAFVLHFDTFFTVDGRKVPEEVKAKEAREGEGVVKEVWRVGKSSGGGSRGASPERTPEIPSSPAEERELPGILRRKESMSSSSSKQRRRSQSRKRANTITSRKSVDLSEKEKERQKEFELEAEFGLEGMHSFSTGPRSEPTHWKQTLFLLREGVMVEEGTSCV
jgi:protein arginine N-methyltransferase 3